MIGRNIVIKAVSVISFVIVFAVVGILASQGISHNAYASTNPNVFVSAENSQWNNYFAGPQVIQVVVADPDINRLDQAYGEPVVTVNGKRLRMAQATDGNWYAYFADRNQAIAADKTVGLAGKGLDFGQFCRSTSATGSVTFTDTKGFTVAHAVTGSVDKPTNDAAFGGCTDLTGTGALLEHVVRQNKTLTPPNGGVTLGQIGLGNGNAWPIIQLYDFSATPTAVTVDYQKSGGDQIVNLTFDRIPTNLINATVDRTTYPENSQVFLAMNDPQLNVDPTEEDSWTWGTNAGNNTLYYQAFNRNGLVDADGTAGMQNLIGNLTTFMFNHNGRLTVNPAASNPSIRVIDFAANGKQILNGTTTSRGNPATLHTSSISAGSDPITFIESGGVNTGVFGNWDGAKHANIVTVNSLAIRGQAATFRYNDVGASITGGFAFGSITQSTPNGTWASGQRLTVASTDNDQNKNSKITEHLNLYDPIVTRIATLNIGTPFTLSSGGAAGETAQLIRLTGSLSLSNGKGTASVSVAPGSIQNATNLQEDEATSQRPIFSFSNGATIAHIDSTTALFIDLKTTMSTLLGTIHDTNRIGNAENFTGFNFLNYDLRSFSSLNGATGSSITNVGIDLVYNNAGTGLMNNGKPYSSTPTIIHIANSTKLQDFINLNYTDGSAADLNANLFGVVSKNANIGILVTFTTTGRGSLYLSPSGEPMVIDFFSIGLIGDGTQSSQKINNGIYRFELGETGDNTGVFTGTNEFVMLNQLNIFDQNTYSSLRPINHDVKFAALGKMTQADSDAPIISYLDLGADGINTKISSQQDIMTSSGTISTDKKTYNTGDTVTVTLIDPDLNVDNSLVDIYTTVAPTAGAVQDIAVDTIGRTGLGAYSNGQSIGELADVEFDKVRWSNSVISGDPHHTVSCFGKESASGTKGGLATSLSATGFSLVETGPSTGKFTGNFQMPDQLCQDGAIVSSITQNIDVNYFDFLDSTGQPNLTSGNSLAFPLQPGSSSDIHTYPNGDSITIPFVSVNNTLLTISYPDGVLFANGDPANHNNTYVPEQPKPIDPICSTGQFYSESGQCLWAPDRCLEGILPDASGHCTLASGPPQPTICSNGNANNSAGFCFSSPQCPSSDYKYDIPSRLCVPNTWPADCSASADMGNLNQEGWDWAIPHGLNTTLSDRTNHGATTVTKANSTGFVVQWMMPRGLIVGYEAAVFYNPINFYQNVPSDTAGQKYMFYQVDYGIGKLLGNRQGLIMTFEPGGGGPYGFIQLKEVPVMPGSKYWITGVLEPAPLANPPAYIVQIVQGTHSWIYKRGIDEIEPRTSPVYKFQSFQDQWISSAFASNLTRDEISYPTIVSVENGNQISLGSFLTSAKPYYNLAEVSINGSYKLLSPHLTTPLPSQPNSYTNSRDCQGFGNVNIDVEMKSQLAPSDNLTSGNSTSIPTPVIPEFGPLVGVIVIISVISVIAITKRYPSFGN